MSTQGHITVKIVAGFTECTKKKKKKKMVKYCTYHIQSNKYALYLPVWRNLYHLHLP